MRFAINYSPQAEQLWRAGKIQVDLFKCPDWPDLVAKVRQIHRVYVHCSLYAGRGLDESVDVESLRGWLDTTATLVINTHLAALASEFPADMNITPEAFIQRAVNDVELLGRHFGNQRIVIENVPYPNRGWYGDLLPEVADPAVISEIVRRTGCGLLLDIAHAIRASEGTGCQDVKAYISQMPLQALRELHVVGIAERPDELGIRRDHLPMTAADWEVTEWAIEQIRLGHWREPDTMAFEYGGIGEKFAWRSDAAVIAEQAPRLYALAQRAAVHPAG